MKILSIETSCDDTGIAILDADKAGNFSVLANIVASQIEIHKQYGGVFPAMAKREHQKNLVPTFIRAIKEAELLNPKIQNSKSKKIPNSKIKVVKKILEREPELFNQLVPFLEKYAKPDIDLIAVTNGPGLEPCLWVGVNFARVISYFWNISVVAVNHIESHILVNYLNNKKIALPALALIVSGGHTQLILMKKIGNYKILGETRDDAAGECFDKCAKILGLSYPGGPEIAKLSADSRSPLAGGLLESAISLPRPMINSKDYDFSFSGLKTAVLYADRKVENKNQEYVKEMCAEVQQAIIDVLLKKTIKAAKDLKVKTIILGGGVSANKELRAQFLQKPGICKILFPEVDHSTDNGLMTAITGYFHRTKKIGWKKLQADANLRISK